MKLFLRLTADVNERLRRLLRYRGDLSRFVEEALTALDLTSVDLLPAPARHTRGTTAVIRQQTSARLGTVAQVRGCSTNRLANSALHAWLLLKDNYSKTQCSSVESGCGECSLWQNSRLQLGRNLR